MKIHVQPDAPIITLIWRAWP